MDYDHSICGIVVVVSLTFEHDAIFVVRQFVFFFVGRPDMLDVLNNVAVHN